MQNNNTQTLNFNKKISVNFEGGELSGETGIASSSTCCRLEQSLGKNDLKKSSKSTKRIKKKVIFTRKTRKSDS